MRARARQYTRGNRALVLLLASCLAVTTVGALAPRQARAVSGPTYDFEDGTAQGWVVTSGSFGQLISNRAYEHNSPSTPYTKQGAWFLSTLETPSQTPNDAYTGEIDAPTFTASQPQISLLVGGGNGSSTYVGVVDASGRTVAKVQGTNSETMIRRTIDVSAYIGQTLHLAVVDQSTGTWGHVTLDDVHVNQQPGLLYDFEDGTGQGWRIASGSFGQLISNRPYEHSSPSTPYTKQGTWFLSTLETPTQTPNDAYTGEVDSPAFVPSQGSISLLVGGGNGASTYVALVDAGGQALAKVQGTNSETMTRRSFDVSGYLGQTLHLAVVDQSTGAWGHVTLDDVRVNQPPPTTYDFETGTLQGWTVTSGSFGLPVTDRDIQVNRPDLPYTKQGAFYLSTLDGQGGAVNDGYTGQLVSPSFVPRSSPIRMMVGGGSGAGEYVALQDAAGAELGRVSGTNSEILVARTFDVSTHLGQSLHLRVVDAETGNWGHVTLDDVQVDAPYATAPVDDLSSTHTAAGSVVLQWTYPTTAGTTGYHVYRADFSSSTDTSPAGTPALIATVGASALGYLDSSVTAGGAYVYSVVPYDGAGTEAPIRYTIVRPYKDLSARGATKVYSGSGLQDIRFPVGPLGDGGILHDGTGRRINWQNFYPADDVTYSANPLPDTFFAVRSGAAGASGAVAALQTAAAGAFPAAPSLTMTGEYPIGTYRFIDPVPGVTVTEQFSNPMVPGDTRDSSLPVAAYTFTLTNTSAATKQVSLLSAQQNAVGWDGLATLSGTTGPGYGVNNNSVTTSGTGTTQVQMTKSGDAGSLRLSTTAANSSATASWAGSSSLLNAFTTNPTLSGPTMATSPAGQTVDAALATTVTLAPGASATVPVTLRWWIPAASHQVLRYSGRHYLSLWGSAGSLDTYLDANLARAQQLTNLYHDTVYSSNLPQYVLDRATSGTALLHTPSVYWSSDGIFGGYEGYGCCDGMPPHVWHYNQSGPQLFPEVGVDWVNQWLNNIQADGRLPERPLSSANGSAIDGQAGVVLSTYREYLSFPTASAGKAWLDTQWAHIKLATDWIWKSYDPNRTGLTSGYQHNTLDTDFTGASSWTGSLYLAQSKAAATLAAVEGDTAEADLLNGIVTTGGPAQNNQLWNGQYYREVSGGGGQSYGNGVAIDMLLGQWWSTLLGQGSVYPVDREIQSLRTLFRDNQKNNFLNYQHVGRTFLSPTDAGMTMFSWPHADTPANAVNYSDETMSGFEYSAAAAMIQTGLLHQGLSVVNDANNRYDGVRRTAGISGGACGAEGGTGNPFGDDECGQWYGRSGSSWSVLQALQGLTYNGPAQTIGFAPAFRPDNHASFFTAGNSWGLFSQTRSNGQQNETLSVKYNPLTLSHLAFTLDSPATGVTVTVNGVSIPATSHVAGTTTVVDLGPSATVAAGQDLVVTLNK